MALFCMRIIIEGTSRRILRTSSIYISQSQTMTVYSSVVGLRYGTKLGANLLLVGALMPETACRSIIMDVKCSTLLI